MVPNSFFRKGAPGAGDGRSFGCMRKSILPQSMEFHWRKAAVLSLIHISQNIAGILGLEAAITYLKEQGFDSLVRYEAELSVYARKRLGQLDGIHILGPDIISPVITLEAEHLGAYDLGVLLANRGIAVRCGAHCAYPLIRRMGKESICRISLAIYNTREEIDYMAEALEDILGGFNGNCRGGKRSDC